MEKLDQIDSAPQLRLLHIYLVLLLLLFTPPFCTFTVCWTISCEAKKKNCNETAQWHGARREKNELYSFFSCAATSVMRLVCRTNGGRLKSSPKTTFIVTFTTHMLPAPSTLCPPVKIFTRISIHFSIFTLVWHRNQYRIRSSCVCDIFQLQKSRLLTKFYNLHRIQKHWRQLQMRYSFW